MRGSEALAIRHISGRRRCAAVPHDVDRYTEPHYSAATLLQPRTLREGTTIKSGTLAVDQALLTSAAGAACPCVIQIGGRGIGDPHGALRAKARVTRSPTRAVRPGLRVLGQSQKALVFPAESRRILSPAAQPAVPVRAQARDSTGAARAATLFFRFDSSRRPSSIPEER